MKTFETVNFYSSVEDLYSMPVSESIFEDVTVVNFVANNIIIFFGNFRYGTT